MCCSAEWQSQLVLVSAIELSLSRASSTIFDLTFIKWILTIQRTPGPILHQRVDNFDTIARRGARQLLIILGTFFRIAFRRQYYAALFSDLGKQLELKPNLRRTYMGNRWCPQLTFQISDIASFRNEIT